LRNQGPQLRYKLWDFCFSLLENSDVPIVSILMQTKNSASKSVDVLDVEVFSEKHGLRLVKTGSNSSFLRLATPGDALLRGAMKAIDELYGIDACQG
jgi:hypothetical protein